MDLFNMRLSKKTSEAGVWIPDEEVLGCMQCKGKFSLLNRKHHCRQCGSIVCGKCSTQRKFMESSRTGTPKRVCDTCFNSDRKPEPEDDEEDEPPTGKMDNLRVSGSGASAPAPAAARAASARNLSVKLPEISMEEAVEALRNHPFEGKWKFVLTFLVVDIGPNRGADAVVSGLQVGSFKSAAAINAGGKRGTLTKDGHVRTGSRVQLWLTLKPKGAAYFQGECSEFGQFGKDGKVTGALQRTVGKINMTIQMVNHKTTTSFNFVGNMDRKGTFCGTFSGCEISKNAGSVSGAFTAVRDDSGGEDGDGAGAGDAGEADGSDDGGGLEDGGDDSEDEAPKKSISKGSSKGKGSRRKGGDNDSD